MDSMSSFRSNSSTNSSLFYRSKGVSPKRSPTTESVQKRRRDLVKSEKAAHWALFNTLIALILYYDLYYMKIFQYFAIIEWIICGITTICACYDYMIHFWPHTLMKPIIVSPVERKLLGIHEDELGFKVQETPTVEYEPNFDNMPPFEIHYSFEEEDK